MGRNGGKGFFRSSFFIHYPPPRTSKCFVAYVQSITKKLKCHNLSTKVLINRRQWRAIIAIFMLPAWLKMNLSAALEMCSCIKFGTYNTPSSMFGIRYRYGGQATEQGVKDGMRGPIFVPCEDPPFVSGRILGLCRFQGLLISIFTDCADFMDSMDFEDSANFVDSRFQISRILQILQISWIL